MLIRHVHVHVLVLCHTGITTPVNPSNVLSFVLPLELIHYIIINTEEFPQLRPFALVILLKTPCVYVCCSVFVTYSPQIEPLLIQNPMFISLTARESGKQIQSLCKYFKQSMPILDNYSVSNTTKVCKLVSCKNTCMLLISTTGNGPHMFAIRSLYFFPNQCDILQLSAFDTCL